MNNYLPHERGMNVWVRKNPAFENYLDHKRGGRIIPPSKDANVKRAIDKYLEKHVEVTRLDLADHLESLGVMSRKEGQAYI